MDQPHNPYSSPEVNPATSSNPNSPLAHLNSDDVKKLRNNSQTLRVVAILGILGCIFIAYKVNNADVGLSGEVLIFGSRISIVLYLAVIAAISIVGIFSLLARPNWGQVTGIVYRSLLILNLSLFSIAIGICGIIALSTSQRLFGPKKISHKEIELEFKLRKKAGQI